MKKLIIKIVISTIIIGLVIGSLLIYNNLTKPKRNTESEIINVNIVLKNKNDEEIINDIKNGYNLTLIELLDSNYEIRYEKSTYGNVLYDFNEIKTDFKSSYIAIYINDVYSSFGIDLIQLENNIKITFKETLL